MKRPLQKLDVLIGVALLMVVAWQVILHFQGKEPSEASIVLEATPSIMPLPQALELCEDAIRNHPPLPSTLRIEQLPDFTHTVDQDGILHLQRAFISTSLLGTVTRFTADCLVSSTSIVKLDMRALTPP